ncbi:MAG: 3-dehydroquinate synthase [Actinomycetota bacterium]
MGAGILEHAVDVFPEIPGAERAFVVADQPVAGLYLSELESVLPWPAVHLPVPEGEEGKTLGTAEALYQQLATQEMHRDDVIVALGGGSVGDVAGFVAATYMRGVPYLQAPTTLTAQVDASIGGKTAVNLPRGKNLVGAFHQPRGVLSDVSTLRTLPDRTYRSGLSEVAKYGLAVDPSIVELLELSVQEVLARDERLLEDLVARCIRAKASVVEHDERDTGLRHVLNYGHTLGHAIERIEGYRGASHGEAVALGMLFAAHLAEITGLAAPGLVGRHRRVLAPLGLPAHRDVPDAEAVLEALRLDKKYRGGVRFVLLEDLGRAQLVENVSDAEIREALARLAAGGFGA